MEKTKNKTKWTQRNSAILLFLPILICKCVRTKAKYAAKKEAKNIFWKRIEGSLHHRSSWNEMKGNDFQVVQKKNENRVEATKWGAKMRERAQLEAHTHHNYGIFTSI